MATTQLNQSLAAYAAPEDVHAGQAAYTPTTLAIYDLLVHGFSNHLVWNCPTGRLLDQYNRHISGNHLDIGVGTGYFLSRCSFPTSMPHITLLDLNQDCLRIAARRLAGHSPDICCADILRPIAVSGPGYDSVSLTYLLHCLPGSFAEKGIVFDNAKAVMNPGAVLFGATLLADGIALSGLARRVTRGYNRRGIFHNAHDSLDGLHRALSRRFQVYDVEVVGNCALFIAHR